MDILRGTYMAKVLCNSSIDPRNVGGYATSEHVAGFSRKLRLECCILIAFFVRFGELLQDAADDKPYAGQRFRHHQSMRNSKFLRKKKRVRERVFLWSRS